MTHTWDYCASTRFPIACHSLQGAVRKTSKEKTLSCMLCWGWIHPSASRASSLQAAIKITLSTAHNLITKIPVGSKEKMMGRCPLWSGQLRVLFHLPRPLEEQQASMCKRRHHCHYLCRPVTVGEVYLQGHTDISEKYPGKCTVPGCHSYYLSLYIEDQVTTGTAPDLWEALY